jgi:hypothetical protein
MTDREIALILLNMSLDMDYEDYDDSKQVMDNLEEDIATLREKDSSLFYVLKIIAMQNKSIRILADETEDD